MAKRMHTTQLWSRGSSFCETLNLNSLAVLLVIDCPLC